MKAPIFYLAIIIMAFLVTLAIPFAILLWFFGANKPFYYITEAADKIIYGD